MAPAVLGGGCLFQVAAQVPSTTNSKSNLTFQPSLTSNPSFLSPRFSTPLSLSSRPRRLPATTATLTLPTAKPERLTSDNEPRWSARALKSFALAELEAQHIKRPKLGTESILLGVLVDGTSEATKYLRDIGVTLWNAREETYKFIDWDWKYKSSMNIGLSDSAQRALDWAVDYKIKSGKSGEITVGHLVLGVWSEKESTGHKVLSALGFDDEKAKELSKIATYDAPLSYR